MTMQRRQEPYTFRDGRKIIVHEANWDIATERSSQEALARADKAKGKGDPNLLYFRETIYPHLGPASTGDVPSAAESLNLPDCDLDGWFDAVRKVNPDWFPMDDSVEESFTFRDGTEITVKPINRPSVLLRMQRLESQADKDSPAQTPSDEVFRILYYPKLAACSFGNVPAMDEAKELPESELNKWYGTVRRVNPSLFMPLEQMAEQNQLKAEQAEKKSKRRRVKS